MVVGVISTFSPKAGIEYDSRIEKRNVAAEALIAAKESVQFAPALSVLFLGARMRALQITNNMGAPQGWAQDAMFLCTASVIMQAIVSSAGRVVGHQQQALGAEKGGASAGLEGFNALLLLIMHGGALAVIISVFLITPLTANGRGSMLMDKVAETTGGFF